MNAHSKGWIKFILLLISPFIIFALLVKFMKAAPEAPESHLCQKYFQAAWRSITAEEAKDIPHKGRKENTITIICED